MILPEKGGPPKVTLILAHGAGAGMHSEFMLQMDRLLAVSGIKVLRFNFDYMQKAEQENKRRPPDSMDKLQQCFLRCVEKADNELPLFIGGKSMGGRVASMVLNETRALGGICLGYPFHPPGKPDKLRVGHLQETGKPLLVLQGQRDPFGNELEMSGYGLHSRIRVHVLPDGDHSFTPRKSSGVTAQQNLQQAARVIDDFIGEQLCR
ncbi:alpha/beta family hydrolase [Bowmanella dokdonensis]|uniref:Alpha/beta hydrolase n=1 Tax=Bowmanella dokdonensis TaxID=751969 RepID=A0A939INM9_9ALTE|nr:alpha/beta family hydrolase [Bowmanella dokdonensis]MBN7825000.1 alpha/beta hydrolase [Bowmanella dokdonensis]